MKNFFRNIDWLMVDFISYLVVATFVTVNLFLVSFGIVPNSIWWYSPLFLLFIVNALVIIIRTIIENVRGDC